MDIISNYFLCSNNSCINFSSYSTFKSTFRITRYVKSGMRYAYFSLASNGFYFTWGTSFTNGFGIFVFGCIVTCWISSNLSRDNDHVAFIASSCYAYVTISSFSWFVKLLWSRHDSSVSFRKVSLNISLPHYLMTSLL